MINNDTQAIARNMAAMILKNPKDSLAETIQGILCYNVENQDRFPAAVSLMEAILQNLCEALEPEEAIL